MAIIVGLGNPGKSYTKTRHNTGFITIDTYAEKSRLNWRNNKKLLAEIAPHGENILAKPTTFMNNSGIAVQAILSYYKLLPKKIGMLLRDSDLSDILTVIHDDMDLPLGKYKTSINSSSAGHNGVKSIINHLKTKKFKRIRMGIAPEKNKVSSPAHFVLQKFTAKEEKILNKTINDILREEL